RPSNTRGEGDEGWFLNRYETTTPALPNYRPHRSSLRNQDSHFSNYGWIYFRGTTLIAPLFSRIAEWTSPMEAQPACLKAASSSWCVSCDRSMTSLNSVPLWMRTCGRPSMIDSRRLLLKVDKPTKKLIATKVVAETSPPTKELSPPCSEF